MSVGRNESCPCGSGKKYKKCCGVVTSIEEARGIREQKMKNSIHAALERLNKFVASQQSPEKLQEARKHFADLIGLSHEEVVSTEWVLHFYNWYLFDAKWEGPNLLERFLQQYSRRIEPEVHRALSQVRLGVYEVEGVTEEELTVQDLATGEARKILPIPRTSLQPGQIILGRLLPLGHRDLALAGSIILQPSLKQAVLASLSGDKQPSEQSIDLYKVVIQSGNNQPTEKAASERLMRLVFENGDVEGIRERIRAHAAFELKKHTASQDVWIYSRRKEAHLFPNLNNALLELHEVGGEILIEAGRVAIEAPETRLDEIARAIGISDADQRMTIERLTSTGTKLLAGTLFITSEPILPSKVLQWAVQTYFMEKWLSTPNAFLNQLPPLLAAASTEESVQKDLQNLVETIEEEGKMGHGVARFMRIDTLRPRLSLANSQVHIDNLLHRPVLEGNPDASYTVKPERFAEITSFVSEMTEGKSEATVKKYDEVMNQFRTFIRGAFGPSFTWKDLRREEVAYFLVEDIPRQTDSLTKTLATNTLSVLTAFFKWLDKREGTALADSILPLFAEVKDDLAEGYRLRNVLQKAANHQLIDSSLAPTEAQEIHFSLLEQQKTGWLGKGTDGETFLLNLPEETLDALSPDWILSGLMGKTVDGKWYLYGVQGLYPPVISELLGIRSSVLV
ncbi:SEC-C metal-binding domain-containing protein [Brevibacillus migulae]|uniref:SEC-C metal-binding domain-containing protein n=1 Tax=Brevibacillus migulae TaxID=1644114 RepID=UPI00106EF7BD|nr:SEC-C metal-binding domain-containing protein [Brevibacillus migulae]